jgi:molecular chaperone GrpE
MTKDDQTTENIKLEPEQTLERDPRKDSIHIDPAENQEDEGGFDAPDFSGEGGMPDMDEGMFAQVQEMMDKLGRAEELEKENADLRGRLGRLAADFESYRRRTQEDVSDAENKGVARAAEALMPIYDDVSRALEMGTADPSKLIPGMQAVQSKVLSVFEKLGLSATGQEGEAFDPQWHEALQVVPGDTDDTVAQVFQVGFRMGERLVRPARVVVSRKG